MKRKYIFFLLLITLTLLVTQCIGPVKDVIYHPSSQITIHDSSAIMRFTLYSDDKPVKPKKGKHYYWYNSNRIHINEGDYSGRLLDGIYSTYNTDGALIVRGSFDKGLKTGRWVTWDQQGEVQYCLTYRRGVVSDTNKTSWIKNLFSVKKDSIPVKPTREKKEKLKIKEKHEKEKNGTMDR